MKNLIAGVLALLLLCGCGKPEGPEIGAVSGIVTMNGRPIEGVLVVFQPSTGRPSQGVTDPAGRYELSYTSQKNGAIVGQHVVRTMTSGSPGTVETIPSRYHSQSELTADVKPGRNTIDFKLNSM